MAPPLRRPPVTDARSLEAYDLSALTWTQVEERAAQQALLAIPVGATEQHGPHLPLDTDTVIAVALARALARGRRDVLVAPALPFGSSGEHEGFPGTLSIGQEATRTVLVELVRSATRTFSRVLLVVGHGGNAEPVRAAVTQLRGEGRDVRAWAPSFGGDAHAGRTETSLRLYLDPAQVRQEKAAAGHLGPVTALLPDLRRHGLRPLSPNGVLGDPRDADAAEGAASFAAAAGELDRFVNGWPAGTAPQQGEPG